MAEEGTNVVDDKCSVDGGGCLPVLAGCGDEFSIAKGAAFEGSAIDEVCIGGAIGMGGATGGGNDCEASWCSVNALTFADSS